MVNNVILVGRICTDIELKYTPNSLPVCTFRIAVDRPYKKDGGEKVTDFIDCQAWRQNAEFINKYLGKGRMVFIQGSLQIEQWEKNGERKRLARVVVDDVKGLDRPNEGRANQQAAEQAGGNMPGDVSDPFQD